jgi:hypothetical protein
MYKTAATGHNLYQVVPNPTGDYVDGNSNRHNLNIVNWVDVPDGPDATAILDSYVDYNTDDDALAGFGLTYSPVVS